jgi:hypothetical protein
MGAYAHYAAGASIGQRVLEQTLLFADVCLFAVIFVSAIAVFAADTLGAARRRIQAALRESDHD